MIYLGVGAGAPGRLLPRVRPLQPPPQPVLRHLISRIQGSVFQHWLTMHFCQIVRYHGHTQPCSGAVVQGAAQRLRVLPKCVCWPAWGSGTIYSTMDLDLQHAPVT